MLKPSRDLVSETPVFLFPEGAQPDLRSSNVLCTAGERSWYIKRKKTVRERSVRDPWHPHAQRPARSAVKRETRESDTREFAIYASLPHSSPAHLQRGALQSASRQTTDYCCCCCGEQSRQQQSIEKKIKQDAVEAQGVENPPSASGNRGTFECSGALLHKASHPLLTRFWSPTGRCGGRSAFDFSNVGSVPQLTFFFSGEMRRCGPLTWREGPTLSFAS